MEVEMGGVWGEEAFLRPTCCSIRQLVYQVPFSFPLLVASSSVNNPDITTQLCTGSASP
jgi:hypothetical protein